MLFALRPKHLIKNSLVLAPALLPGVLSLNGILKSMYVFLLFSLLTAGVYLINDIFDYKLDIQHPFKKSRPLASGIITRSYAVSIAVIYVTSAIVFSYLVSGSKVFILFCIYLIFNIAYSLFIKVIPYLEMFFVGIGFPIRVLIGFTVSDVEVNKSYLTISLLLIFYLALSLITSKRIGELVLHGAKVRPVLRYYSARSLNLWLYFIFSLYMLTCVPWLITKGGISGFLTTVTTILVLQRIYSLGKKALLERPDTVITDIYFLLMSGLLGFSLLSLYYIS